MAEVFPTTAPVYLLHYVYRPSAASLPLLAQRRCGGRVASRVARLAMKIRVAHGARRHEVTISGSATVAELKDKLQPLTGVPAQLQDLQIMGDSLCDEASLAEQGVQNLDKLELVGGGSSSVGSARPPVRAELRPREPIRAPPSGRMVTSASASACRCRCP